MPESRTVQLPEDLCAAAETWIKGRFPNLESLLTSFLQEITQHDPARFDESEEQMIEQRLKDLGYM